MQANIPNMDPMGYDDPGPNDSSEILPFNKPDC